jgi:CRP-like cAMP-binding protein
LYNMNTGPDELADEARDGIVSEDEAIEMLAACQRVSSHFSDFNFQQLITLSKELTVLRFKKGETVLVEGEPATFFGVVLDGALATVGHEAQRGVGAVVGEMALFHGGSRTASLEAAKDGYLAVFSFRQLASLHTAHGALASKLSRQLALATLQKQSTDFSSLSPAQIDEGVAQLLRQCALQQWDSPDATSGCESLLSRASSFSARNTSTSANNNTPAHSARHSLLSRQLSLRSQAVRTSPRPQSAAVASTASAATPSSADGARLSTARPGSAPADAPSPHGPPPEEMPPSSLPVSVT